MGLRANSDFLAVTLSDPERGTSKWESNVPGNVSPAMPLQEFPPEFSTPSHIIPRALSPRDLLPLQRRVSHLELLTFHTRVAQPPSAGKSRAGTSVGTRFCSSRSSDHGDVGVIGNPGFGWLCSPCGSTTAASPSEPSTYKACARHPRKNCSNYISVNSPYSEWAARRSFPPGFLQAELGLPGKASVASPHPGLIFPLSTLCDPSCRS
jgi:hypothetical protein